MDKDFDGDCEGALGLGAGTSSRLGSSAGPTDSGRLMGDEGKEDCFGDAVDLELVAWQVIDGVFGGESERASRPLIPEVKMPALLHVKILLLFQESLSRSTRRCGGWPIVVG